MSESYDKFIKNGKFLNDFEYNESLGSGYTGVIIKARSKIDNKFYAIKIIPIAGETELQDSFNKIKEIKVLENIKSDYCVKYYEYWLELEGDSKERFIRLVPEHSKVFAKETMDLYPKLPIFYLSMEYCPLSLQVVIKQMQDYFKIDGNPVSRSFYYMASELLVEILEAAKFLHDQVNPVIHRDLKPVNILICPSLENKRFIKIGDFSLAVMHKSDSQSFTQGVGGVKYMAPEVQATRKYNFKADIYSIGVIIQELFNFDINFENKITDPDLKNCFDYLLNMTIDTLSIQSKYRPSCAEMLNRKGDWKLDYNLVKDELNNCIDINTNYDIKNQFVQHYLKFKISMEK